MATKRVVGFSGGADSQATALWVRQRYAPEDIILLNTQAGRNEHPLTVGFVQMYSTTVFPVVEVVPLIRDLGDVGTKDGKTGDRRREFDENAEMTFRDLAYVKGIFPSRKAQFCTEYLKLAPQKRWCDENLLANGIDYERYIGVRRDESEDRKCASLEEFDDYFDCTMHRPLADWTKAQVFDFLKAHGEEVNPLYRMGFGRVGCAPCINSGKDDIREWAARFPEMIDKIRAWEQSVGRAFFAPMIPRPAYRKAFKAWAKEWLISGSPRGAKRKHMKTREGAPPPPDVPVNWVDEVVEWSRTTRGGKQMSLPMVEADAANGTCVSRYGLCE